MNVLGFTGLLIGLVVLIYLKCFKQMNVLLAALISVFIIIVFNGLPIWDTIVNDFAASIGNWIKDFLIVFTLGALLGSSLQSTGSAQAIGEVLTEKLGIKHIGIIIHALSLGLVFAGIDSIVAMLAIAPISIAMVRKANLPRRFAIACYLGGGCSYVFGLPGTSAVNNLMPMDILGTTTLAGWLPGLLGSLVSLILVLIYQKYLENRLRKKSIGFDLSEEEVSRDFGCRDRSELPPVWVGLISLLIVIIASVIIGGLGIITPKAAISAGLIIATAFNLFFGRKYIVKGNILSVLETGATDGVVCSILTGAMLGFVAVVQATQSFTAFSEWACAIKLPPLLSTVFSIQMMNVVLANSPGSIRIFMSSFSSQMLAAGVNPAVLHRVVSMASVSFAAMLPHNPGSVVLTSTYKTPYNQSFADIGAICIAAPLLGTLATVGFASLGII